jgi:alkanesulfonate monooxygenase SsuD/methylene tetrahydromethanopterin reductase-like flavin-dependent oxidoreductase (luciferase family)
MKFGILATPLYAQRGSERRHVAEHEELVRTAEELGFDVAIAGQHFLGSELRYYQPVPYLTHLGHHAPTMKLLTGIILLSLLNPVEVAEQVATLDVLSGGRAIFGAGLGYSDHEFQAFGVSRKTRVGRFEEALEIIKALWSGEEVSYHGRHFQLDGARTSVLPLQEPRPAIWIGGQSLAPVQRAARLADAWYAPPFPTHEGLRELREAFLEERARVGLPLDGDYAVRRELLIAPTHAEALAGAAARMGMRYATYIKWGLGNDLDAQSGAFGSERAEDIEQRFILGPPEVCAQELARLRDEQGMTHFMFKPSWPEIPNAHAEAMAQLELFGTEVIPLLRANSPSGEPNKEAGV